MNPAYETGALFQILSDAEASRWRHIRLAIKPCYIENHASQIKSYYGTLSGSHGRSSRIRHVKLSEAPPGGEITMTSNPIGNETSLSWKPCVPDKKLLWYTTTKSWSLFQNPSWKMRTGMTMTSYPVGNKTSLSQKPSIVDKKLLWITIGKS